MHKEARPSLPTNNGIVSILVFLWNVLKLVASGKLELKFDGNRIDVSCDASIYYKLSQDVSTCTTGTIHSDSRYYIITSPLPLGLTPTEYGQQLEATANLQSELNLQSDLSENKNLIKNGCCDGCNK